MRSLICLLFALVLKMAVMAQTVKLKWINFSPYTVPGQNPNFNSHIPSSQIKTLLDSLVSRAEGIRIFGTLSPLDSIPYFAKQRGLKVIVGIWLGNESTPAGKAANIAQINKGISIAQQGYADRLIVGSEVLYRGDMPADTLIRYIRQVKLACPNIPVSCADVYYVLAANPAVINACDFVSPNLYPFWEGVPVDCAMQRFHQAYLSLLPFANGKEVFISESGWKTFGNPVGNAVPSLPNAIKYNRGLLAWSRAMNKEVNLFIAFDEPWKEPTDNGWGIFTNNAILKPGMDTLFKPFTNIDSVWLCSKLNNPGIDTLSVDYVPLIGSNSTVKGRVNNIRPCDYKIATYIKVGGWWTKPYFFQPTVPISCDGSWNVNYATHVNDLQATEICVFLVPSTYSPPLCGGCPTIPAEVYQNAIKWKCFPRSTIPATLTASRDTVCLGDAVTLTAAGGNRYLWSTGDTMSSITVTPNFNTSYTVEVSVSPGVGTIVSKTITVNSKPAVSLSPANQTICSGTTINQINSTSNAAGATYTWTRSNTTNLTGIAASGTGSIITGTLINTTNISQTTTFTITGTVNGCSSSITATITVNPKPVVTSTPENQTVCSGKNISQIVNTSNTNGTTYTWTRNNIANVSGIAANGTTATITGTLTNPTNIPQTTTFSITATANGCASSTTATTVTVNPQPTVGLTAAPLTTLVPGKTTILTATPSASTGGTITTSWLYNSNPIAVTGNSYVVNIEKTGAYQVFIQETWPGNIACTNQSPVVTIDASPSDTLFIFPNPGRGPLTVSYYNTGGTGNGRIITIYDPKGAMMYHERFPVTGPYTLLKVNFRPVQTGIYFIMVRDGDGNELARGKVVMRF